MRPIRDWAADVHGGLVESLDRRASHPLRPNASDVGDARIYVSGYRETGSRETSPPPEDAVRANEYCFTTDVAHALATDYTGCKERT